MYPYEIGGIITLYGIMVGIGVLCCFVVFWTFCKQAKVESRFVDFATINGVVAIGLGFISAALFQAIYDYIADPSKGFDLFGGGLTFIGGLIGGAIVFLAGYAIFRKKYQGKLVDIISILPCSLLIAHAFGRVGCFCAGCCYGVPTESWIGIKFVDTPGKVVPTNLIEAIFLFILFAVCAFLFLKYKFKYNMPLYLAAYGVFRFIIEYWRDDERGNLVPGMSPSQFWSLLMVVLAVPVAVFLYYMNKRRAAYLAEHPIVEPAPKPKKVSAK